MTPLCVPQSLMICFWMISIAGFVANVSRHSSQKDFRFFNSNFRPAFRSTGCRTGLMCGGMSAIGGRLVQRPCQTGAGGVGACDCITHKILR
jgi:hypothetical protein